MRDDAERVSMPMLPLVLLMPSRHFRQGQHFTSTSTASLLATLQYNYYDVKTIIAAADMLLPRHADSLLFTMLQRHTHTLPFSCFNARRSEAAKLLLLLAACAYF